LIDRDKLIALTGASDDRALREAHQAWIEKAVEEDHGQRHHEWSEAVAVGSEAFVLRIKQAMGVSATGRKIKQREGMHLLREPESAYSAHLAGEKAALSIDNTVYYVETSVYSMS